MSKRHTRRTRCEVEPRRFPAAAFDFLREGLDHTVKRVHGEPCAAFMRIVEWLSSNEVTPAGLRSRYRAGNLPREILDAIREIGGPQALDHRHVTGEQLCCGLRELALQKWGMLAPVVLSSWGVHVTRDFGEMVFGLVEAGMLQKRPNDRIEDFDSVFEFDDAFGRSYHIPMVVHS